MDQPHAPEIAIIGAGPAGLAAAETASAAGARVTLHDHMPSPARKLLMAGKSGLNITKSEGRTAFHAAYDRPDELAPMLDAFGPKAVVEWMDGLRQNTFIGSTGRVFPKAMKASPLLRAWLARLSERGVELNIRWRWTGWDDDALTFDTPGGPATVTPAATILATGGASWRRLGSDGEWAHALPDLVAPFRPSNVGFAIDWSPHMERHFGTALKNAGLIVNGRTHRGEITLSRHGLEGGGLYPLTPALRDGAPLALDLKPDLSASEITARLARPRGKASLSNHLRKTLRLQAVQIALLREFGGDLSGDFSPLIKHLPVPLHGPHPLDEAISTAGGLRWDALDDDLMLRSRPGTFACGEMLDWEAPTGGYLLTACLATGRWAGHAAARRALR